MDASSGNIWGSYLSLSVDVIWKQSWWSMQGLMEHHKKILCYFAKRGISVIFFQRRNMLNILVSILANSFDKHVKLLNDMHVSHVHSPEEVYNPFMFSVRHLIIIKPGTIMDEFVAIFLNKSWFVVIEWFVQRILLKSIKFVKWIEILRNCDMLHIWLARWSPPEVNDSGYRKWTGWCRITMLVNHRDNLE